MKTINNHHTKEVFALNPGMQIIEVILVGTGHRQNAFCLLLHQPVFTETVLFQYLERD